MGEGLGMGVIKKRATLLKNGALVRLTLNSIWLLLRSDQTSLGGRLVRPDKVSIKPFQAVSN